MGYCDDTAYLRLVHAPMQNVTQTLESCVLVCERAKEREKKTVCELFFS